MWYKLQLPRRKHNENIVDCAIQNFIEALCLSLRLNLSKLMVLKHFGWEFLHEELSCHLGVVIYTLKCVFCRDILLENEFERCVNLSPHDIASSILP